MSIQILDHSDMVLVQGQSLSFVDPFFAILAVLVSSSAHFGCLVFENGTGLPHWVQLPGSWTYSGTLPLRRTDVPRWAV